MSSVTKAASFSHISFHLPVSIKCRAYLLNDNAKNDIFHFQLSHKPKTLTHVEAASIPYAALTGKGLFTQAATASSKNDGATT